MRAKRIAFPEGRMYGVQIDGRDVEQFEVTIVGGPRHGYVSVRGYGRGADGEVTTRTVAVLAGRRKLLELAKAILRRDSALERRRIGLRPVR